MVFQSLWMSEKISSVNFYAWYRKGGGGYDSAKRLRDEGVPRGPWGPPYW